MCAVAAVGAETAGGAVVVVVVVRRAMVMPVAGCVVGAWSSRRWPTSRGAFGEFECSPVTISTTTSTSDGGDGGGRPAEAAGPVVDGVHDPVLGSRS